MITKGSLVYFTLHGVGRLFVVTSNPYDFAAPNGTMLQVVDLYDKTGLRRCCVDYLSVISQ
jgi:hypothetical protein